MKIDSGQMTMESRRSYASLSIRSVSTRGAAGKTDVSAFAGHDLFTGQNFLSADAQDHADKGGRSVKETSDTAFFAEEDADVLGLPSFQRSLWKQNMDAIQKRLTVKTSKTEELSASRERESSLNRLRQSCIDFLFRLLFYRRADPIARAYMQEETDDNASGNFEALFAEMQRVGAASSGGMELYTSQSYYEEIETTSFSTEGTVVTSDGREIPFQLSFDMTRRFAEYYEESYGIALIPQTAPLIDPLVINFDGDVAELSDQKFTFDLDADGTTEQVSLLRSGSGFLALDIDGNGKIDDGKELFGTRSGDGFADLAAYDTDGNGWIDENDPVFDRLLIWARSEDGEDALYHLKEKGVGAISVNAVSTQFTHTGGAENAPNGMLRSTAIFLYENGGAGTIQHVDLAS